MNIIFRILVGFFMFFAGFCYAPTLYGQTNNIERNETGNVIKGTSMKEIVHYYKKRNPDVSELSDEAISILALLSYAQGDKEKVTKIITIIRENYDKKNPGYEVSDDEGNFDIDSRQADIFFYKMIYPETPLENSEIDALFEKNELSEDYERLMKIFIGKAIEEISGKPLDFASHDIAEAFAEGILNAIENMVVNDIEISWSDSSKKTADNSEQEETKDHEKTDEL